MKKLYVLMAMLSVLLPSCHKDDTKNNSDCEKIHVTADISQREITKVDIEPNDDFVEVFWINKDKISVFGESVKKKSGTASFLGNIGTTLSERAKTATFEGDILQSNNGIYYAMYPFSDTHESLAGTNVPLDLSVQKAIVSSDFAYITPYMYMIGKEAELLDEKKLNFSMEHLCSLLQFNVKLKETKECVILKSVKVAGNNIKSKKSLNVYQGMLSDAPDVVNSMLLTFPEGEGPLLSTTDTKIFMTAFPAEEDSVYVSVTVENDGVEQIIEIPAVKNSFHAGKRDTKYLELDLTKPYLKRHIYVAGVVPNANNTPVACYWKDGNFEVLANSASTVNTVIVMNNMSYISGQIYDEDKDLDLPCYWKGGELKVLPTEGYAGFTTHMCNWGNDIYICGAYIDEGHTYNACYWKNDELIKLPISSSGMAPQGIFVDDKDVFVAGGDCYWKNNELMSLQPYQNIYKIIKSNENIYMTGVYRSTKARSACWKNDEEIELENSNEAQGETSTGDLFAVGDDTYIIFQCKDVPLSLYWKNGLLIKLPSTEGICNSIKVFDKDVYVSGIDNYSNSSLQRAVYWKNGEMINLHSDRSRGLSIFVFESYD